MGLFFQDPAEWAALAMALGLTPHEPSAGFGATASFRHLKRSLGPVAAPPPKFQHWLRGRRNGRRVLVVLHIEGSGSHRTAWTSTVTEIDPPLFIGASIGREGTLSTFFGGEDLKLGIPPVDDALRLGALDPVRLRALLLTPAGSPSMLSSLCAMVQDGFKVTDSTVVCSTVGYVTDPGAIARQLDQAAWLANELETRKRALGQTAAEARVEAEWRTFAEDRGLTFDAPRMHMHGTLHDAGIEVALETNAGRVQTSIGVRFPRPVGLQLHLTKAGTFAFLTRLFSQDIDTGDRAFDDAFIIQGHPEPAVRAVFQSPMLRATLLNIAGPASELSMTEQGVFWLWPAATIGSSQLDTHVRAALGATEALFGRLEPNGPYR
jgi:hypothetical protein